MLVSEISLVILPVASSFENCGGDFKPVLFSFLTSFLRFPGGSVAKNLPASEGVTGSIPSSSGRCPEEGNGNPHQYSCLENPMDRVAWWDIYGPWGHKELDTTEPLHFFHSVSNNCLVFHFRVIPLCINPFPPIWKEPFRSTL